MSTAGGAPSSTLPTLRRWPGSTPTWPSVAGAAQQQAHLDIEVTDLDAAVEDAIALRARLADFQPQDDVRVLLDPVGHPFCLYLDPQAASGS